MISEQQKSDLIDVVRITASREILPRFRNLDPGDIELKASTTDLVTVADRMTEDALTSAARTILPGTAVIGEEAVAEDAGLVLAIPSAERCVIIDPIDGTMNFARGIAVFGVLLAVVEKGETVFALLYDPVLDDWCIAEPGAGAWLCCQSASPRRLATRNELRFEDSSGLVHLDCAKRTDRADLLRKFEDARQVHDLRCSCHEYRMLASGEADFIVALTLHPWDHAAGQLLVREAGGWSALEGGGPYTPTVKQGRMVTASCRGVGEHVASILF